jgi:hypothetical protein
MAMALVNGRVGCEAIEIPVALDVPNPNAFPTAKDDAERLIVVGAKPIFRLN